MPAGACRSWARKCFSASTAATWCQFGADRIADVGIGVNRRAGRARARAMQRGLDAIEGAFHRLGRRAETLDAGALRPGSLPIPDGHGEQPRRPTPGLAGFGCDHLLGWQSAIPGAGATAQPTPLTVDAHTECAPARHGDVDRSRGREGDRRYHPVTNSDAEVVKGLRRVAVKSGPTKYTEARRVCATSHARAAPRLRQSTSTGGRARPGRRRVRSDLGSRTHRRYDSRSWVKQVAPTARNAWRGAAPATRALRRATRSTIWLEAQPEGERYPCGTTA